MQINKTSAIAAALITLSLSAMAETPQNDGYQHMGVATCATSQCHGSAIPRDGSNVLQNEYVTWTQSDPHARAYETLGSEQSRAIANRLGLSSASTAKICLDCHADNVPPGQRGDKFQMSDGVGCEACHGGAQDWLATHYNTPAVTYADNLAAGLQPIVKPADRAELCLSCHLGTRDKFATHRIMAAGHPRLAFELDTFTELWRTAGRQPHYLIDNDYKDRKNNASHSLIWATGVLTEARRRLSLINSDIFEGNGMFPELGLYDCHACHRSMKSVQWQALPRHGNAGPGVPFLNDGSLVLSLALARSLSPDDAAALQDALADMHNAASQDVATVRSATANLDVILRRVQSKATESNLRQRELPILRDILAIGAEGNYLDYVSAEQAFMAIQMLVFEIGDPVLEQRLTALGDALIDDERYRPEHFARLLRAFGEE